MHGADIGVGILEVVPSQSRGDLIENNECQIYIREAVSEISARSKYFRLSVLTFPKGFVFAFGVNSTIP